MKFNFPSRKEMNEDKFHELISKLAEHTRGGDREIIGELFPLIFTDLSAVKQEQYIKILRSKLKEVGEGK